MFDFLIKPIDQGQRERILELKESDTSLGVTEILSPPLQRSLNDEFFFLSPNEPTESKFIVQDQSIFIRVPTPWGEVNQQEALGIKVRLVQLQLLPASFDASALLMGSFRVKFNLPK